jgi:hypothetical protein
MTQLADIQTTQTNAAASADGNALSTQASKEAALVSPSEVSPESTAARIPPPAVQQSTDMALKTLWQVIDQSGIRAQDRDGLWQCGLALRHELQHDQSDRAQQLLIDEVVLCYVRVMMLQQWLTALTKPGHNHSEARYWDKRLSTAESRYYRAIDSLTQIRKRLGGPNVQINIAADGGQQVVQPTAGC